MEIAANPVGPDLRATLRAGEGATPELHAFYAARDYRPLWHDRDGPRPEARALIRLLADSAADGLDPQRYRPDRLAAAVTAAESGGAEARARAETLLSLAFADYVADLHRPTPAAQLIVTDPAAAPAPPSPRAALEAAGRAPDLNRHLAAVRRLNPVYEDLRRGLAAYRARWAGLPRTPVPAGPALGAGARGERVAALRRRLGLEPSTDRYESDLAEAVRAFQAAHGLAADGVADARTVELLNAGPERFERLILANLERARALPADPGPRFVLVDAAAARLDLYEDRRVVDSMRVVVGKPEQPTPTLAGVIRYAVLDPYWNVPEDLARDRVARRVLTQGPGYLRREGLEVLSDWSSAARVVPPEAVDWAAAAAGRRSLRVRQRPGPANMMGRVKLMLPNRLGVYLHDTPDKRLFAHERRTFSAGCVRLEDAARLTRRLIGVEPRPGAGPNRRVDLPRPVPVYIVYLTAAPGPDGIAFRTDVYGRDPTLLAALDARGRLTTAAGP